MVRNAKERAQIDEKLAFSNGCSLLLTFSVCQKTHNIPSEIIHIIIIMRKLTVFISLPFPQLFFIFLNVFFTYKGRIYRTTTALWIFLYGTAAFYNLNCFGDGSSMRKPNQQTEQDWTSEPNRNREGMLSEVRGIMLLSIIIHSKAHFWLEMLLIFFLNFFPTNGFHNMRSQ